jgi:hypothetical protein
MAELEALSDGFSAILKKSQEVSEPAYQKMQAAEEEFAKTKGELGVKAAELKAKSARGSAGGQLAVYDKYEKELMAPPPTIQYSAETADGMKNLAMLLPIAGMMMGGAGQLSGVGALKAMSGVLEGHKQGNQDRIALEQKNFEQQMQNWKLHQEQIKGAFERALQRAKINASAAQSGLQVDLAKLDAQLLLADVKKNGIIDPLKRFNAMNEKVTTAIESAVIKMYTAKPTLKNLQEYTWTENGQKKTGPLSVEEALAKRDQEGVSDFQKAPTGRASAQNQRFAFNVREAFAQTAQDLKNVTLMPKDTVLGAFSGLTGQGGSGLVDSLRNVFAREITPEDQRQFQILISGFENNLSRALGGGYANSGSARAVDAYKTQVAREGDSPSAKALFLARAKQELNILSEAYDTYPGVTPEDINFIKKYTDLINQSVPFDVSDVVIASPRSSAKPTSKKIATEEDILATMAGQNLNRNETIKKLKAAGFTIEGE